MGNINIFNIGKLLINPGVRFFIETGTYKGEGVEFACAHNFEKIFSIEIFDEMASEASRKFSHDERVSIINDNSSSGLKSILSELKGNSLFWLDAHFPMADAGLRGYEDEKDPNLNIPLLKELEIISTRRDKYNDVMIIDDLRLFEDVPPGEPVVGVNEHWKSIGQPHVTKENLVHFDLAQEVSRLFPDHAESRVWIDAGFLILTPRNS